MQLSGVLVDYADRLAVAARRGYAGDLIWDPAHSPLLDNLGTLLTYLAHPAAASHPVPQTQSFDVWWLALWRIDGVPAMASVCAGALIGVLAVAAVWQAWREAIQLRSRLSAA